MATRTRYKSPSPSPAPSGTISLDSAPHSPLSYAQPLSPSANTSKPEIIVPTSNFPSSNERKDSYSRSDLPLRAYPASAAPTVLPPIQNGHVLGASPNNSFGPPPGGEGWRQRHPTPFLKPEADRQRSLSIQSLISSPGADQTTFETTGAGKKRKGSDDDDVSSEGRNGSVSMEDPDVRDAVEALGGLRADFTHAAASASTGSPPSCTIEAQEPLLHLLQSNAHPLLSTAISLSSSTYAASKSYSPSFRYVAESAENFSSPAVKMASSLGRRTGIESVIRRRLSSDQPAAQKRRKSEKDTGNGAANDKQIVAIQPPEQSPRERGWGSRVMYSSTGLATALSDESRKSLKYCLRILSSAAASLVKVIETLTNIVAELEAYLSGGTAQITSGSASGSEGDVRVMEVEEKEQEDRRRRLAASIEGLKDEALTTLKTVVNTVSQYAGGALPENARNIVKRQLLTFPMRWQTAAASATSAPTSAASTPTTANSDAASPRSVPRRDSAVEEEGRGKAMRVLAMAREGLDMMRGVAEVVQATLESADEWCGVIGKRRESEMGAGKRGMVEVRHGAGGKRVSWVDGGGNGAIKMDLDTPESSQGNDTTELRRGTIA